MTGTIHVFPAWQGNPYLNMLYVGAVSEGWSIEGSKSLDALERGARELGAGDVLHVHWTSPILQRPTRSAALSAVAQLRRVLDDIEGAGAALVWTIHNAFSHDARYPDLEVELAELLAQRANTIIQINGKTREVVADSYELPFDKVVTLKHASYSGIYPPAPSMGEGRRLREIDQLASVVGFIGQIRPYKGLPTLFKAMDLVAQKVDDTVLLLAGKTTSEDRLEIERQLPKSVSTVRHHAFISDADIGGWFAACDIMVFPYERVLNSGSILLSATFGRPCVIPAEPHLVAEWGDQPWVMFYDPGTDRIQDLAKTIERGLAQAPGLRAAALEFAASYRTLEMAWDYVRIVERIGERPVEAGTRPS